VGVRSRTATGQHRDACDERHTGRDSDARGTFDHDEDPFGSGLEFSVSE
jgi:hypothetical protein